MSDRLRHMAIHSTTGARCVVICMKLEDTPNEKEHCLVVETDSLPPIFQDAFMEVVKSSVGQQATELLGILSRNLFPDGSIMLETLHRRNFIKKLSTDNVFMTPTNQHRILLSDVNKMVSSDKINENTKKEEIIEEVETMPTVASNNKTAEKVAELRGAAINVLKQAELMIIDARKYIVKAVEMDDDLNFNHCLTEIVKKSIPEVFNTSSTTENKISIDMTTPTPRAVSDFRNVDEKISYTNKAPQRNTKLKKDGTPQKKRGRKSSK